MGVCFSLKIICICGIPLVEYSNWLIFLFSVTSRCLPCLALRPFSKLFSSVLEISRQVDLPAQTHAISRSLRPVDDSGSAAESLRAASHVRQEAIRHGVRKRPVRYEDRGRAVSF